MASWWARSASAACPDRRTRNAPVPARGRLRQNLLDDITVHVGQAHVTAVEPVGQRVVFESEQMQDRGVQLVDGLRFLYRLVAVLVGGADDRAPFDTGAG